MKKKFSMGSIMKKMAPVLFISVFLLPLSARSEIKAGSVEVSPFAGFNIFENRQNLDNNAIFGGRLGYNFTNHFGIEATGEFIQTNVDNKNRRFTKEGQFTSPISTVNITMYHLDLIYHFLPEGKFNPFITGGYGAAHYSPEINNKNMSIVDFGVGAKFWVADNIALRADVRDNMVLDETIHNVQSTLGVVFAFGGKSKAAPAPLDSDGDEVFDTVDKCPNTPARVAVDKDGCPLDFDKDGVPDYLDKCQGTPAGAVVDSNGCQPVVKTVVSKVIILASEPKVEQKVVAVVSQKKAEVIVLAFEDVHFDFDQATLTPEAKTILKRDIRILKENPNAKIRVAGYTSASGTDAYNQNLSERRATAVKEYLIAEGVITRDRLSKVGYGESSPAAYEAAPADLYSEAAKSNMRVLFEIVVD